MDVNENLGNIIALGVSFSPIVMMLVEAIKTIEIISHRFLPLVSLLVGFIFGLSAGSFCPDPNYTIPVMSIGGLVSGGMACGLYDITNRKRG
jgi:hypothetical protein